MIRCAIRGCAVVVLWTEMPGDDHQQPLGTLRDDSLLRAKARHALEAGYLPKRSPDMLLGGLATGDRCAVCGVSTTPGETELELQFTEGADLRRTTFHAHPHCFAILNVELRRLLGGTIARS